MAHFPARPTSAQSMRLRPHENAPQETFQFASKLVPSGNRLSVPIPHSSTLQDLAPRREGPIRSSRTWTTTSGDLGLLADADAVEDRAIFVYEYNRLAKKHGVRVLMVEDFDTHKPGTGDTDKRKWYHRLFRSTTDRPTSAPKLEPQQRNTRRRSASELAYLIHNKKDLPKTLDIQSMVRLSGKSVFYLPNDYTPCSLVLPTCLRATAQYLEQNVATRGLFRVPGSVKAVGAIVDYYCHLDKAGGNISGTVRCATLPAHIPHSIHDIGSVFKRLLSMLPGGVLGSLSLFDALVAINSQLAGVPEFPRTQQSKVRARLIALAIGTVKSQYRRELICAVFGLLSHIGRVAEVAPREDEDGRSLPTTDLMGYEALGIVFGPLLVCDLLEQYSMNLVAPDAGMLVLPLTAQKAQRAGKERLSADQGPLSVDKIHVANEIAEMLISNWRDVVRQMKALGTHHRKEASAISNGISASASESLVMRLPKESERPEASTPTPVGERSASPEPETPTNQLTRRRSRAQPPSKPGIRKMASVTTLSPTLEEEPTIDAMTSQATREKAPAGKYEMSGVKIDEDGPMSSQRSAALPSKQVYLESVPPRVSSREQLSEHPSLAEKSRMRDAIRGNDANTQFSPSIRDRRQDRQKRLLKLRTRKHDKPKRGQPRSQEEKEIEKTTQGAQSGITAPNGHTSIKTRDEATENRIPAAASRLTPEKAMDLKKVQPTNANPQTPTKHQAHTRLYNPPATDPTHKQEIASRYHDSPPIPETSPRTKRSVKSLAAIFENQNSPSPRSPSWNEIEASIKQLRRSKQTPREVGWLDEPQVEIVKIKDAVHNSNAFKAPTRVWENGGQHRNSQTKVLRHSISDGAYLQERAATRTSTAQVARRKRPTMLPAQQYMQHNAESPRDGAYCRTSISQTILKASEGDTTALFQLVNKLHEELSAAVIERDLLRRRVGDQTKASAEACQEQLLQARKEALMWRRRAEEAERRNKIFENFTARLRGIRDAAVAGDDEQGTIATVGTRGAGSTPRVRFLNTGRATQKEAKEEPKNEKLDSMYGDVAALWGAARELLDADLGQ